jgi:hypothetical protein
MMAGTKPPDLSNAISTLAPSQKIAAETKNPLGLSAPAGQKCLISDLLTTPQHARRMAVMMMMPTGLSRKVHRKAE